MKGEFRMKNIIKYIQTNGQININGIVGDIAMAVIIVMYFKTLCYMSK